MTLENLSKLIESKKIVFSKLKNNSRKAVLLKFKKDKIVNKINKSSLLLKFLIQFESETTFCYCRDIVTKNSFSLVFTKFRNLLMIFATLDCVNKAIDNRMLLF